MESVNEHDAMEIDSTSFNSGRRRKFDEFVVDDPEEMVRENRPLHHQLPTSLRRRAGSPELEPVVGAEVGRRTWTSLVLNTLRKGTQVVAVISTMCRTRLGSRVSEARIYQTCHAAVQSSYNAAKRCLVSLSAVVPVPSGVRRRHLQARSPRLMVDGHLIPVSASRYQETRDLEFRRADEALMAALNMPPLLLANFPRPGPVAMPVAVTEGGDVEMKEEEEKEEEKDVEMEDVGPVTPTPRSHEANVWDDGDLEMMWELDDQPETPSDPFGSFPVQIAPSTPISDSPAHLGGYPEYHPDPMSQLPKQPVVDYPMSVASSSYTNHSPPGLWDYRDSDSQVLGNRSTGTLTLLEQYSGPGIQTPSSSRSTQYHEWGFSVPSDEEGMQDQNNTLTQSFDESIANCFVENYELSGAEGNPGPEPDNLEDLLSDTSEDGESHGLGFDTTAADFETCDQLLTTHDFKPDLTTLDAIDSSHGSSPQASGTSAHVAVGSSNSIDIPATAIDIKAGKHSNLGNLLNPSTPKQAPKKSVAFFASPKTGRPITATKKFIMGETMSFPASSSPPSEVSSLSMNSGSQLSDNSPTYHKTVAHSRDLKHQDSDTADYLHQSVIDSTLNHSSSVDIMSSPSTHTESASRSQDAITQNEETMLAEKEILSPEETTVSVTAASPVLVEADAPAMEEESIVAEDFGSVPSEQVSSRSSSESESRSADHPISLSSSRKRDRTASQTGRGKMPTRTSARHSAKNSRQPQNLAVSFSTLEVSNRLGSSRVVAKKKKEKARHQEQAAHEAAERARLAKEEVEEKAREEAAAEEERRKNSVRRVPKERVIQPLNATWEAKVQQALNTPNMRDVLVNLSSGATLTRKDLGTLKVVRGRDPAHGWLNDEIIAACLQHVVDYGLRISNHKAGDTPKYHAFNTFFYKNLRDKGAQSVKRWAGKAKIGKDDLLKAERVFIPVHQGAHWTLLVVSPFARTIEYFDSMGGQAAPYILNAKKWLAEELGKTWKEEEWTVLTGDYGAGPMQENGSDCGVFTCTTARMVVLGVDPMSYGGNDMAVQRSRMVAELLNGGLVGDFEPRVVF